MGGLAHLRDSYRKLETCHYQSFLGLMQYFLKRRARNLLSPFRSVVFRLNKMLSQTETKRTVLRRVFEVFVIYLRVF